MKFFIVSALLIGLIGLHFCNSSFLGDRLNLNLNKEGNNNVFRKSKGCTVLCSLKINFNKKNNQGQQQTCYQLPGKNNATVSECVYNCLKLKGEKLENATECACQNGVCVGAASAAGSSSSSTTNNVFTIPTTQPTAAGTSPSSTTRSPTTASTPSSNSSATSSTTVRP